MGHVTMSCAMEQKTIFVKVGRNGGKMVEYAVRAGSDIIQICNQFNIIIAADEIPTNGGVEVPRNMVLNGNCTIMLSKKSKPLNCRVARIGQQLMPVYIQDGDAIQKALIASGRLPFEDEEIWLHFDGIIEGKKVLATEKAIEGAIYVIEKKNNLRNKVMVILKNYDSNEEAANNICAMLKADYKMQ
jgi:hypothetical protein